jgi:dienelactone hydrolase
MLLIVCALTILAGFASAHAGIHGEAVEYTANGTVLKGYLAYDVSKEGKRPGVLVVHEWWGHNDYARKRADMLAELGYTALAVDMYGDGKQAEHPDDAAKFSSAVMSNMKAARARFMAALNLLREHQITDPDRIAAIGYCFGGGVVLQMARAGVDLVSVVSFHGNLSTKEPAQKGKVKAKILVCHGAEDQFTSQEQIDEFEEEMKKADVDYQFISYEGAKHSFTNPDADKAGKKFSLPLGYNAKADKKSWADMQDFFMGIFEK